MTEPSATRRITAPLQAAVRSETVRLLHEGRATELVSLVAHTLLRATLDTMELEFVPDDETAAHNRFLTLVNINGALARGLADALAIIATPDPETEPTQ